MLEVDGICVQVQRAPIRNLYLTVRSPDATVNVRVPYGVSDDSVIAFVKKKRRWIDGKRANILQNPFCRPKLYVEGECHLVFGKPYSLYIGYSHHASSVHSANGTLMLCVDEPVREHCAAVLSSYLFRELHAVLNALFAVWSNIMQLTLNGFAIRTLKRLWGSCHISKRHITINSILVHYPLPCIEYVVVHELVHLWEPSHNHRFYRLLERHLPRWRDQHNFLKKYPIGTYR